MFTTLSDVGRDADVRNRVSTRSDQRVTPPKLGNVKRYSIDARLFFNFGRKCRFHSSHDHVCTPRAQPEGLFRFLYHFQYPLIPF